MLISKKYTAEWIYTCTFSELRWISGSLYRYVNNFHSTTKIQVLWEVYSGPHFCKRVLNKTAIGNQKLINQVIVSSFGLKCSDITNIAANMCSWKGFCWQPSCLLRYIEQEQERTEETPSLITVVASSPAHHAGLWSPLPHSIPKGAQGSEMILWQPQATQKHSNSSIRFRTMKLPEGPKPRLLVQKCPSF